MKRIICANCAKIYDYHETEFCPKCWYYNRPHDSSLSHLEPGGTGGWSGAGHFPVNWGGVAKPRMGDPWDYKPGQLALERPTAARPRAAWRQGARRQSTQRQGAAGRAVSAPQTGAAAQQRAQMARVKRGVVVGAVIWLLLAVVLPFVVTLISRGIMQYNTWNADAPAPDRAPEIIWNQGSDGAPDHWTYEQGDAFPFQAMSVSVEDAYWLEIPSDATLYQEGYSCLLVDLWIDGGTRRDDLVFAHPYLELEDGTTVRALDDARTERKLGDQGVYAVTLSDCQWEDPLYGQLVFFVPAGAGGPVSVWLEEYAPGGSEPIALYEVLLELW